MVDWTPAAACGTEKEECRCAVPGRRDSTSSSTPSANGERVTWTLSGRLRRGGGIGGGCEVVVLVGEFDGLGWCRDRVRLGFWIELSGDDGV